MERTRQGIRVGRVKLSAGDVDLAVHIWKKALESAYEARDYAAMYVLSKNLGDACAQGATVALLSTRTTKDAMDALQKGIDYYRYALDVIDTCALHDVLGDQTHSVLNKSAGYVHARLQKLTAKLEMLPPPIEKEPCATCAELFEELVLDENDGCRYCQGCYDEYYASVEEGEQDEVPGAGVDASPCGGSDFAEELQSVRHDGDFTNAPLQNEESEISRFSDAVEEAVRVAEPRISEDPIAESDVGSAPPDAAALGSHEDVVSIAREHHQAAEQKAGKKVYSIAELLSLRAEAPVGCPSELRSCPVHIDSVTPTSRSSSSNGSDRKSASKQSRSVSSSSSKNKQSNKASDKSERPRQDPSSATSSATTRQQLSALPSVELCRTLRDLAIQKQQHQQGPTPTDAVRKMALRVFAEPCDGIGSGAIPASTFATDLDFFIARIE